LRVLADEMEARADELERKYAPRDDREYDRADGGGPRSTAEALMTTLRLRLVLLLVLTLALTGCPGPNYAPYDNMNNNSPG
jgi:hypothetical protein